MAMCCKLLIVSTVKPSSSSPRQKSKPPFFFSSLSTIPHGDHFVPDFRTTKRMLLCCSIIGSLLPFDVFSKAHALDIDLLLQRYTDSKQGFTLLTPSSWIKVDKAGATALFEEPNKGSNSVGVVVSPVRISKLSEFGSPEFVADKLIQAEKRKESTKDAMVISVSQRQGHGGLEVYEFEYRLDSTRGGLKRVFSAAFVASKKLYLLNISHSDGLENPLDMDQRTILERVLHSFDTAPYT